jgi:hypothetical protein
MPTASDLVTDLPADFETFGQAVATSMADLLGGTTGQVLSKASNTDMDFTWVAQDDSNAIQNAIVDAKGDLIAATAADTPARLAVGANGETLIADSTAATGLKWAKSPNFVGCSLYQTAGSTSITNGTYVAMAYDAERFDTHGFHDNVTNNSRITIPAGLGGYYLVRMNTRFDLSAVGTRQGALFVNGVQVSDNPEYTPSAAVYVSAIGSLILNLNAGDYLQHAVRQTTAGALSIYARNEELPFQVQFLGA